MRKLVKRFKINNESITFVIPFELPWDWTADYERQTCLEIAKTNEVIVYEQFGAEFILKHLFSKGRKKRGLNTKNVKFYKPLYIIPLRRISLIEKLNQIINLLFLRLRLFNKRGLVVWIFSPDFYFYPKFFFNSASIYDCVDFQWNPDKKLDKKIKENEKKLIKSVDFFFVNSQSLYKLHKKTRRADKILPQGFSFDEFKGYKRESKGSTLVKPTIGFVGGINYRLDFNLLYELAKNNPQWCFEFYGPYQSNYFFTVKRGVEKIQLLPNVFFGGKLDRKKIVDAIDQFTIAIIPYNITFKFNKYCYPMKLFEYFYMGKPVVSTPIDELKRFPEFVKIGAKYKEWEKHIKMLLEKPWPKKYQMQQLKLAKENSWEEKIKVVNQVVTNCVTLQTSQIK